MRTGEIVGTVWGSVQAHGLAGMKLAVVRPHGSAPDLLAVDRIGADVGQVVLVGNGSRIRDLLLDDGTPVKTVVLGIIDGVDR